MKQRLNLISVLAAGVLAGCSNGAAAPPMPSQAPISSPSYSTLQFAVGTANIAGSTGLNTVVTLRQSNGLSAFGESTPAITWDGNFVNTGATGSNTDKGLPQITGHLPANPAGSAIPSTTFGTSYGAFGYGFVNSNSTTSGQPAALKYPCLPLYPAFIPATSNLAGGTSNCGAGAQFVGGAPAFPNNYGNSLSGYLGYALGFTAFAGITPAANASGNSHFTLNVAIPVTPVLNLPPATATMTNFTPLATISSPPVLNYDGNGGGTVSYQPLSPGVTEALLILVNYGWNGTAGPAQNCNYSQAAGPGTGGNPPYFYSVLVHPGDPNPIGLGGGTNPGDNLGATPAVGVMPAGKITHTFCSAADNGAAGKAGILDPNGNPIPAMPDQYQSVQINFDYPAYEAAYPQSNGNPKPPITGANGQADISISDLSAVAPVQ